MKNLKIIIFVLTLLILASSNAFSAGTTVFSTVPDCDSYIVLTANITTPALTKDKACYVTANSTTTRYTNFTNGAVGKNMCVLVNDQYTTFGFSSTYLHRDTGTDYGPAAVGDYLCFTNVDGSNWVLKNKNGATAPDGRRRLRMDTNTQYTCSAGENSWEFVSNLEQVCQNGVPYSPRMNKSIYANSAVPTISSCGNGSPAAETGSTNLKGAVTIGATGAGCIITFAQAFTNAPACVVGGATASTWTVSTTAITVTSSPGRINWICSSLNE